MDYIKRFFLMLFVLCITAAFAVPVFAAGDSIQMESMHELDSDESEVIEDESITDSYGKTYTSNIVEFDAGYDAFVTYDLNGEYAKFDASIVCSTETGSNASMNVGIFADGVLVYNLSGYTRQKAAEKVNLDVAGVGKLSIKTSASEGNNAYLYFVESSFQKAQSPGSYPNRATLSDLVEIDSKNCDTSDRLFVDTFGNIHNEYQRFDTGYNGYILYNLEKKYTSFSCRVVAGDNTGSDAVMNIEFYLDDKLVYSGPGMTKQTPAVDVNLDVTNASVLKIVTSKQDGYYSYLYVTDGLLKAHEHTPGDWTVEKEATCTEEGTRVKLCKECGEVAVSESVPAVGHTSDGKWVVEKEATCSEEGEEVQHCKVCKEIAETREIEKTKHTPGKDWEVVEEATCNSEGRQILSCSVCGEVVEEKTIPTTEHDYGAWETLSGSIWNPPVIRERTCSICGNIEHDESNATFWLHPLVLLMLVIIIGGAGTLIVIFKKGSSKH